MSFCSLWSPQSVSLFSKPCHGHKPLRSHFRASADVPGFLSANWLESPRKRPFGPRLNFTAEEAVQYQLDVLMFNDQPCQDYGIEVMYRVQADFHHSTYRVLLGHKERKILSSSMLKEDHYKQRVWIRGARPGEEEVFQFTMVQRVGGSWDGYWLTESLLHDGDSFSGGVAD